MEVSSCHINTVGYHTRDGIFRTEVPTSEKADPVEAAKQTLVSIAQKSGDDRIRMEAADLILRHHTVLKWN